MNFFNVFRRKKGIDMFSFLASSHRTISQVPLDNLDDPDVAQEIAARYCTATLGNRHGSPKKPRSSWVLFLRET